MVLESRTHSITHKLESQHQHRGRHFFFFIRLIFFSLSWVPRLHSGLKTKFVFILALQAYDYAQLTSKKVAKSNEKETLKEDGKHCHRLVKMNAEMETNDEQETMNGMSYNPILCTFLAQNAHTRRSRTC